jgi:flagellar assembly factor FliW
VTAAGTLAPGSAAPAVPAVRLVELVDDLPGFPGQRAFVRVPTGAAPLDWLQAVDPSGPRFLVVPPAGYVPGYAPRLTAAVLAELGLDAGTEPELLCLVTVPDGDAARATMNLRAPLVLDPGTGRGRQVVLADGDHPIRHPMRR